MFDKNVLMEISEDMTLLEVIELARNSDVELESFVSRFVPEPSL